MEIQNERYQKELEAQNEQRKIDNQHLQKESEARIAQLNAEQAKLNKETRYYPLISLVIAGISSLVALCSAVLLFLAKHG